MRLACSISILSFVSCSAMAQQSACPPTAFLDTDFSARSSMMRLIQMSDSTQEQFNKTNASAKTGMIIPYIDVPAKGDFDFSKDTSNFLRQKLGLDFSKSEDETVLHVGLTAIGAAAYMKCLDDVAFVIDAKEPALTEDEFLATLSWKSKKGEKGIFSQKPVIIGGVIIDSPDFTAPLEPGSSFVLHIKRDSKRILQLSASVNGDPFEIDIPPVSRKEIKSGFFVSDEITEHSDSGNNWGGHDKSACYNAPDGHFFIKGTETPVIVSLDGGDMGTGVKSIEISPQRACISVHVNSSTADRAAAIHAKISVLSAWVEDIP